MNENIRILITISLKFVPKGPINNIPALIQIMALHRPGGKGIIWTNDDYFTDAYKRHLASNEFNTQEILPISLADLRVNSFVCCILQIIVINIITWLDSSLPVKGTAAQVVAGYCVAGYIKDSG